MAALVDTRAILYTRLFMSQQYAIEIKSLLGSKEKADNLIKKVLAKGGRLIESKHNKQLNHYFTYHDLTKFQQNLLPKIPTDKQEIFSKIINEGKNLSIRTREANNKVILVIKASLNDHSSANGVTRAEFESEMRMGLAELDLLLIDAGLEYQAKWSRERNEYKLGNTNVCIDKNAGYGYLAEFENVVEDEGEVENTKQNLISLMAELGAEELRQDRLERMFSFYNSHWPEYYGTDKVFNIE